MKKAEFLKQALENITQAMRGYENMPGDYFFDVAFEVKQARALVEALESLRWVNLYKGTNRRREIANTEVRDIIMNFDIIVQNKEYLETVGIIRLKDDEQ